MYKGGIKCMSPRTISIIMVFRPMAIGECLSIQGKPVLASLKTDNVSSEDGLFRCREPGTQEATDRLWGKGRGGKDTGHYCQRNSYHCPSKLISLCSTLDVLSVRISLFGSSRFSWNGSTSSLNIAGHIQKAGFLKWISRMKSSRMRYRQVFDWLIAEGKQ